MEILYEDNHIIIVNKRAGEIVQGDKTGDEPLVETLKKFIKERDAKPGAVFMGVNNKSYASPEPVPGAKEARLQYRLAAVGERYCLLEVRLLTGRKHQIRVQLSAIGSPVKGDLKYGDRRSNPDGSISLHARRIQFVHPVSGKEIDIIAPVPAGDRLWAELEQAATHD